MSVRLGPGGPTSSPHYAVQASRRDRRQKHEAVMSELAVRLRAVFGQPSLTTRVVEGSAERVLAEASAGADRPVLGSTSAPALAGRSAGPQTGE
jgi:hypothetical protein